MGNYKIKARDTEENRIDYSTWLCCSQLDEDIELSARINRRVEPGNHRADYTSWACCSQLDDDAELN